MKAYATALMAVSLALAGQAYSYEQGDLILRVGAATVDPDGDGGLNGDLSVDEDTQLGITGTYMLTDNWGLGLLAATPFSHDIKLDGAGKVGETKHLPPTLTAQYYFNNESNFTPFVGAGINWTTFFEEDTSGALAGTELELDDSLGWALEAGVDWALDDKWVVSAQVWYIDIETDADLNGSFLTEVEIDPWVYMIGIGYKF